MCRSEFVLVILKIRKIFNEIIAIIVIVPVIVTDIISVIIKQDIATSLRPCRNKPSQLFRLQEL